MPWNGSHASEKVRYHVSFTTCCWPAALQSFLHVHCLFFIHLSLSFPHHTFWCIHLLAKFFTYARVWRKRAEMMYRNVSNQFLFSFAIILRAIKKALMLKYIFPLRIVLDEQPVSDPLLSQCKSWVCFWTKHCDFLIHKIIQKKCTCPWIGQWYLSFLVLAPVNGWILCH